jgi:probable O-glycosylation ligase (exosortase A-associated)
MRDLLVSGVVFGSVPLILWRPWIGIIMWCWLSYMNPHKQAWGFATTMPFALIVALATLVGMLFMREPKKFPWTRETVVMVLFLGWMFVTTNTALFPALAWPQLEKVAKILLMTFVTLILINTREKLHAMVWIIALSIGYYGVKGGIFTLATGGAYRVWGPSGTFIGGNNEIALALVMTIPLMRYLQLQAKHLIVRHGLTAAMLLSAIAAIGTQSRGALIAIAAMGAFLWLKSRGKLLTGALIVAAVGVIAAVMPESWHERMRTIMTYEEDASAMGRLHAWRMAWNLAIDRPLVGGGFETFQWPAFAVYAPEAPVRDVHSIYFEVLGEHGFVGLALFLALYGFAWLKARHVAKLSKAEAGLKPFGDLARMIQVSLVGYAAGGAFLGLAYFDLPYHLVSALVIAGIALERQIAGPARVIADAASGVRRAGGGAVARRLGIRISPP